MWYQSSMPSIHVRNVPEEMLGALKRRAELNRRSLQKEIEVILASAVRDLLPGGAARSLVDELALARGVPASTDMWGRDEIYGDDGR